MAEDQRADLEACLAQARRSERRLRVQYAVTRVLAESSTLKDAGHEILRAIGESLDWELGMFWAVDKQAELLRFVDLWHAPQVEASEFIQDSRERTFQRGVGLIGRTWESGTPIWIPDVTGDPHFRRASIAAHVGLHGGFAFPVRKGERIDGVIEFFSHQIRKPDQDILDMVADIGIKVGQFVDREQTAEALRQAEALADVARLLGDIGHDIKNMLMPIMSGAALLEEELDECYHRLPESVTGKLKHSRDLTKELLDMIRNGSRRIQDRVREMAESVKGLTRLPEFAPCRLAEVVAGVYAALRILADQRKVALRVDGLDTLPVIQADESRLFNAIYNLVNNAIPEVSPGGSVTLRGRTDQAGRSILVSVIDTGRGMPAEVLKSLFTYSAISRKVGGTGLGTKIVKDVVDAHGGSITVESEPGVGTSFHITLPLEGPPPHSQKASTNSPR
ncbi:MAG: GAF domain-containing sensor histidine kinase [Nitrospira sp.]